MNQIWAVAVVVLLAGCAHPVPPPTGVRGELAALHWPTLDVGTTPTEPNEARGLLRVAWSGTLFGVESASEPDLRPRTIVAGATTYTSSTGLGWIRSDIAQELRAGALSNRLLLWDLQALSQDPALAFSATQGPDGIVYNATGTIVRAGVQLNLEVGLVARAGTVVFARVASPAGRESPYSFAPAAGLSFEVVVPSEALGRDEAGAKDALANEAHVQVYHLIEAYRANRQGLVPDTVDEGSLRVELLASGQPWPTNPYSGAPVADRRAHGDFRWAKCGPTDARFAALGWDAFLFTSSFGRGCKTPV